MKRVSTLLLPFLIAASLTACKRQPAAGADTANEAPASAAAPVQPSEPAAAALPPPTAAAPESPAPAGKAFDLQSVAVLSKTLPEFPYLGTPSGLKPDDVFKEEDIEFDKTHVVAGEELRRVEGRIYERKFFLHTLKMSPLAAHRNYETALKAMGATRVDTLHPADEKFVQANGGDGAAVFKKMGIEHLNRMEDPEVPGFEQWLIRTPSTNIWLSFYIDNRQVYLRTVEEKAMQQVVEALPAAKLSSALQQHGHVALYLNFDTDSHALRTDSLAAVDEVVKLLQGEPTLKLRVEGHTDATGDAAHNRTLSQARAESVVKAITARQIAASRLSAVGKGPDQPLADNATEEGKAKNRRVELVRV